MFNEDKNNRFYLNTVCNTKNKKKKKSKNLINELLRISPEKVVFVFSCCFSFSTLLFQRVLSMTLIGLKYIKHTHNTNQMNKWKIKLYEYIISFTGKEVSEEYIQNNTIIWYSEENNNNNSNKNKRILYQTRNIFEKTKRNEMR